MAQCSWQAKGEALSRYSPSLPVLSAITDVRSDWSGFVIEAQTDNGNSTPGAGRLSRFIWSCFRPSYGSTHVKLPRDDGEVPDRLRVILLLGYTRELFGNSEAEDELHKWLCADLAANHAVTAALRFAAEGKAFQLQLQIKPPHSASCAHLPHRLLVKDLGKQQGAILLQSCLVQPDDAAGVVPVCPTPGVLICTAPYGAQPASAGYPRADGFFPRAITPWGSPRARGQNGRPQTGVSLPPITSSEGDRTTSVGSREALGRAAAAAATPSGAGALLPSGLSSASTAATDAAEAGAAGALAAAGTPAEAGCPGSPRQSCTRSRFTPTTPTTPDAAIASTPLAAGVALPPAAVACSRVAGAADSALVPLLAMEGVPYLVTIVQHPGDVVLYQNAKSREFLGDLTGRPVGRLLLQELVAHRDKDRPTRGSAVVRRSAEVLVEALLEGIGRGQSISKVVSVPATLAQRLTAHSTGAAATTTTMLAAYGSLTRSENAPAGCSRLLGGRPSACSCRAAAAAVQEPCGGDSGEKRLQPAAAAAAPTVDPAAVTSIPDPWVTSSVPGITDSMGLRSTDSLDRKLLAALVAQAPPPTVRRRPANTTAGMVGASERITPLRGGFGAANGVGIAGDAGGGNVSNWNVQAQRLSVPLRMAMVGSGVSVGVAGGGDGVGPLGGAIIGIGGGAGGLSVCGTRTDSPERLTQNVVDVGVLTPSVSGAANIGIFVGGGDADVGDDDDLVGDLVLPTPPRLHLHTQLHPHLYPHPQSQHSESQPTTLQSQPQLQPSRPTQPQPSASMPVPLRIPAAPWQTFGSVGTTPVAGGTQAGASGPASSRIVLPLAGHLAVSSETKASGPPPLLHAVAPIAAAPPPGFTGSAAAAAAGIGALPPTATTLQRLKDTAAAMAAYKRRRAPRRMSSAVSPSTVSSENQAWSTPLMKLAMTSPQPPLKAQHRDTAGSDTPDGDSYALGSMPPIAMEGAHFREPKGSYVPYCRTGDMRAAKGVSRTGLGESNLGPHYALSVQQHPRELRVCHEEDVSVGSVVPCISERPYGAVVSGLDDSSGSAGAAGAGHRRAAMRPHLVTIEDGIEAPGSIGQLLTLRDVDSGCNSGVMSFDTPPPGVGEFGFTASSNLNHDSRATPSVAVDALIVSTDARRADGDCGIQIGASKPIEAAAGGGSGAGGGGPAAATAASAAAALKPTGTGAAASLDRRLTTSSIDVPAGARGTADDPLVLLDSTLTSHFPKPRSHEQVTLTAPLPAPLRPPAVQPRPPRACLSLDLPSAGPLMPTAVAAPEESAVEDDDEACAAARPLALRDCLRTASGPGIIDGRRTGGGGGGGGGSERRSSCSATGAAGAICGGGDGGGHGGRRDRRASVHIEMPPQENGALWPSQGRWVVEPAPASAEQVYGADGALLGSGGGGGGGDTPSAGEWQRSCRLPPSLPYTALAAAGGSSGRRRRPAPHTDAQSRVRQLLTNFSTLRNEEQRQSRRLHHHHNLNHNQQQQQPQQQLQSTQSHSITMQTPVHPHIQHHQHQQQQQQQVCQRDQRTPPQQELLPSVRDAQTEQQQHPQVENPQQHQEPQQQAYYHVFQAVGGGRAASSAGSPSASGYIVGAIGQQAADGEGADEGRVGGADGARASISGAQLLGISPSQLLNSRTTYPYDMDTTSLSPHRPRSMLRSPEPGSAIPRGSGSGVTAQRPSPPLHSSYLGTAPAAAVAAAPPPSQEAGLAAPSKPRIRQGSSDFRTVSGRSRLCGASGVGGDSMSDGPPTQVLADSGAAKSVCPASGAAAGAAASSKSSSDPPCPATSALTIWHKVHIRAVQVHELPAHVVSGTGINGSGRGVGCGSDSDGDPAGRRGACGCGCGSGGVAVGHGPSAGGGGGGGSDRGGRTSSEGPSRVHSHLHPQQQQQQHPQPHPLLVVLTQVDVTEEVAAQKQTAGLLQEEHRVLESIFPRHCIEYLTLRGGGGGGGGSRFTADRISSPIRGIGIGGGAAGGNARAQDASAAAEGVEAAGSVDLAAAAAAALEFGPARLASLATWHPSVTILFCDIVGFTTACHATTPFTVMAFLNNLYSRFDGLVDIYKVYKVETIGDCYMVAGGLVAYDEDGYKSVISGTEDPLHAVRTFEFAKAMLRVSREVRMPHTGEPVQLRVGLHSGPVTSGVVGDAMPRFCLFGDTVNVASRMESTCQPGRIHVSAATQSRLPNESWRDLGMAAVKGKGEMHTYEWAGDVDGPLDVEQVQRVLGLYL